MQSIPAVSTNSPLASLFPVVFIILVGIGKELYLEVKRYKEDKRLNEMEIEILKSSTEKDGLVYQK